MSDGLTKKQIHGWVAARAVKALGPGAKAFLIQGADVAPGFRYHVMNKMDDGRMVGGHGRTPDAALAMARQSYLLWQTTPTVIVKEQA